MDSFAGGLNLEVHPLNILMLGRHFHNVANIFIYLCRFIEGSRTKW